ncbi:MAG: ATP-binding protein [Verrucomicrobiota bacterium]
MKALATSAPLLDSLDFAVFNPIGDNRLKLIGNPPKWLASHFEGWDAENQVLEVESFSSFEAFIEADFSEEENARLIIDESFGFERRFIGEISRHLVEGRPVYIVRPADELDAATHDEVRALRESALDNSTFGASKRRKENKKPLAESIPAFPESTPRILELVAESTGDALLVFGRNNELLLANSTAQELFPRIAEAKAESLSQRSQEKPLDSLDRLQDIFKDAVASRAELETAFSRLRQGLGESLTMRWRFSAPYPHQRIVRVDPVEQTSGPFDGMVWNFSVAEKYVTDDAALNDAERFEAVGRFAGGIAHDFNNLLAIVIGNLNELQSDSILAENPDAKPSLEMASQAAAKATTLIQQLLGYSKLTRLEKEKIAVNGVINSAWIDYQTSLSDTPPRLQCRLNSDLWEVEADPVQLAKVIESILENADLASEPGDTIEITARNFVLSDPGLAEVIGCAPNHYVVISIADHGCGMNDDVRRHIFDPFFTTRDTGAGSGLGLSNALGVMHQHDGNITCTSAEGEGTTVNLYLPRARRAIRDDELRPAPGRNAAAAEEPIILVVDDEELLRNLVCTTLKRNGYRPLKAANGLEALQIIKKQRDRIMAVTLDLAMPTMTGTETFREMNAAGIDIPVVIGSGFLVDTDAFVAETGGKPYAIFSKPYQLTDLLGTINDIRDTHRLALSS